MKNHVRSLYAPSVFLPLFWVLTLVAVINSIQTLLVFKGTPSTAIYLKFLFSKIIFCWYYIFLAVVIEQLSLKVRLTWNTVLPWMLLHLTVLVLSLLFHQLLMYGTDRLLWHHELVSSYIDLLITKPTTWLDITAYLFFVLGFFMIDYQRVNQEQEIRYSQMEMQLMKSQLQELRNTLRPRLLFTTLQIVSRLVGENRNKEANKVLVILSDFLRSTVYASERDECTLEEELRSLHQYLEIEKVHFNDTLIVHEEIPPDIHGALVPNYILQPLVEWRLEDAFRKGIHSYELNIDIKKSNHDLLITMNDNNGTGSLVHSKPPFDAVMYQTMHDRLTQLYGDHYHLHSDVNTKTGMSLLLRLPYHETPISATTSFPIDKR